ncbi:MAG: hypothetical protein ACRDBY_09785 [Cetobacterium sp.]|uniref:hypothetical protein n=1 Tax=Cetobacterium sp. TaxID=2071632 RepID=UPI003EE58648
MVEYIGYHATETMRVYSINHKGFKHNHGWLGKGAYFFDSNDQIAKDWGRRKYPTSAISVFKAVIKTNKQEDVFDVRNPYSADSLLFAEERNNIIEAMKAKGVSYNKSARDFDALIFNKIKEDYSKKIIIHNTYTYVETQKGFPPSHVCNGTEICISDNKLIKSLEVLK